MGKIRKMWKLAKMESLLEEYRTQIEMYGLMRERYRDSMDTDDYDRMMEYQVAISEIKYEIMEIA